MHKATVKTTLLAISLTGGLIVCGIATAGGRGTPAPPPPMIVKTAVDTQEKVLIITGRNFGAALPTVTLADQALHVTRFSEREVVAKLPRDLAAATYGVTVITHNSSGRNRISSNLFSAMLPDINKKIEISAGEQGKH